MKDHIGELPPGQAPVGKDKYNRLISFDGAVSNQIPAAYAPSAPPNFSLSSSENKASDERKIIEEEMKYNHYSAILPSAPKLSLNGDRSYGSMELESKLINDDDEKQMVLRTDGNDGIEIQYNPMELLDPRDTLQQVSDKIAQV